MSWSYANPSVSTRDWVRWMVGDTDSTDELLQDEEIDAAVSDEGNKYRAAATCARAIASKFSRQADKRVGPLQIAASQKAERYEKLAERLDKDIGKRVAAWAGGISEAEMREAEQDTDRVDTSFERGMHDSDENVASDNRWTESESWSRWP